MDTFVDYYELLHVQPTAPEPVIKASYRTMMQKLNHHPDRGGEVGFAQLLNDAVKTLCNQQTRARYDALRKQFLSSSEAAADKKSAKRDAWGEPGGSPEPAKDKGFKKEEKPGQRAHTSRSQTDSTASYSKDAASNYTPLPSKPQCPFCLSIYPSDNTTLAKNAGYTALRRCHQCNGARTPITQLAHTSSEELRKMHRQQHETSARLFLEWPCESPLASSLNDFSPAGCALVFSKVIDIDRVVMIETELFNAICKVRHCKPSTSQGFFVGLEFVTLDMIASPGALLNATA
ncbi:MAG: J domain-containing protein [Granulosicoccus sp.]